MRDLIWTMLTEKGHAVATAASVEQALAQARAQPFDVAICDLELGEGGDGLSLIRAFRTEPALTHMAIVVLSRHSTAPIIRRALQLGADDYVLKPLQPKRLSQTLERWGGLAALDVRWTDLSKDQAQLLRLSVSTMGRSFEQARQGTPESFDRTRSQAATIVRAGEDKLVADALSNLKGVDGRIFVHSMKLAAYLGLICHLLSYSKDETIDLISAGLLHDIGYARVPPERLNRSERSADEAAWLVETHARHGRDIVAGMSPAPPETVASVIAFHHERLDGTGPLRSPGKALSEPVRIAIVVNEFLMYREARKPGSVRMPDRRVLELLKTDPGLDQAMVRLLEQVVANQ